MNGSAYDSQGMALPRDSGSPRSIVQQPPASPAWIAVFVIKAYKLLSRSPVVRSDTVLLNISSPQGIKESSGQGSGGVAPMVSSPSFSGVSSMHQARLSSTFTKIATLYNAIVTANRRLDGHASAATHRSANELYHIFQSIVKDLQLANPSYGLYFERLAFDAWKIKEDDEIIADPLWDSVSTCILSLYDQETGYLRSHMSKFNSTETMPNIEMDASVSAVSPNVASVGSPAIETPGHHKAMPAPRTTPMNNGRVTKKSVSNEHSNNMLNAAALPLQLQRKLHDASLNTNNSSLSRSLNGYYTQPTSPGLKLGYWPNKDDLVVDPSSSQLNNGTLALSNNPASLNVNSLGEPIKRRSLGSLIEDPLEEANMEDLLQFATSGAKKPKDFESVVFNEVTDNIDMNILAENGTAGATLTGNSAVSGNENGSVFAGNFNNIELMNNATFLALSQGKNGRFSGSGAPERRSISNPANVLRDKSQKNDTESGKGTSISPRTTTSTLRSNEHVMTEDLKRVYENLVSEKDQHILQLEKELESQRQEAQWLRKMLIEDMGCVRGMLSKIKK